MAILLGIDVETSGLDPENDRVIEVGAVMFDWETKMPMQILSELVDPGMDMTTASDQFELSEEITAITGITSEALQNYGAYERDVLVRLDAMSHHADYYVAHNGNTFDRLFVEASYRRHSMTMLMRPWLDTMVDIKFHESIKTRNLHHLGADNQTLNPFRHRAVFDVLTMFKVMEHYDLAAIVARSQEPMVYVRAFVSYEENQKAKDFSFRWNAGRKIWWKAMKASDCAEERDKYQFKYEFLDNPPE